MTAPAAARLPVPALDRLDEVTRTLAATAGHYDRTAAFPYAAIRTVHEAGLLTAGVAPEHGGAGAGPTDLARILLALGKGDPSVALITAMTLLPHAFQTRRPWPPELYAQVLAESAAGPTLLNNARVEPDLGSPARGGLPATLARRTAGGWSVSGHKRFVTGAEGLSYFLVWAGTDEPRPRVGTFVVPAGSPGIEVVPAWRQLGLRASGSHDLILTEVEIPAGHVLDLTDHGPAAQQDNLAAGSLHVLLAALYLGVARAAQTYVHRFAHERVPANLGRPVASTDRFRQAAGEIETLISTAEQLVFGVTGRLDRGLAVPGTEALAAKVVAVRHATTAVQTGLRLLGNPGLSQDNPLERHFRDIQSAGVHAPQEDTALLAIGQAVLAAAAPRG
ncbi:acyl-CoA dehydrogenase family protein [Actinacidiphila acididurans]|uniref:Acyl-CoA/acyl-ACP dehydrogenase n=1 Tax=Actinacidiphila acididurans TaxID=2784346 RepID=A0ABS2U1W8_9ACTN|nr:acyl-CoA dehydrogenase family protein [Actinacidiphila acididurans]MBM9509593.1 acyl-CoA/acyl-ACP dehydrogenase [Actinacidiphila acididurans]